MRIEAYGPAVAPFPKATTRPQTMSSGEAQPNAANEKTAPPAELSAHDKLRALVEEKRLSAMNAFDDATAPNVLGSRIDLRV